jgi:hypothetical protein
MTVKYPQFDGTQVCSQIPLESYYLISESGRSNKEIAQEKKRIKSLCYSCSYQVECLEWALHYERYGIWGGTTEEERKVIRSDRKIKVKETHLL